MNTTIAFLIINQTHNNYDLEIFSSLLEFSSISSLLLFLLVFSVIIFFVAQLVGSITSPTSHSIKETGSRTIKEKARTDAKEENFNYSSLTDKEIIVYKKLYKEERFRRISRKAISDAHQMHRYETKEISFTPTLQGSTLKIPAEIAHYQEIFVNEKSKLQEKYSKNYNLNIINKSNKSIKKEDEEEKDALLDELYKDDNSEYIPVKKFYKSFSLDK